MMGELNLGLLEQQVLLIIEPPLQPLYLLVYLVNKGCMSRGQKTVCNSWFSPSTMWVSEWNLGWQGLHQVSLPTEPSQLPYLIF